MKNLLIIFCLLSSYHVFSQYTEVINSNRPGESFGAYSVGNNVLQLETGVAFGEDNHVLELIPNRAQTDYQYQIRYGILGERLEMSLYGVFASTEETLRIGGAENIYKFSNFQSNTLGMKYLVYDPNVKKIKEGPNLYSWKKNNLPQWSDLIPAVSLFAGANILLGENPFQYFEEPNFSPKVALITQNNFGPKWVLVSNFIYDKFTTDYPIYAGIFTLTHALYARTGVFVEFQTYINDLYSDELLRGGMAFLLSKNLQVDISGLVNFKNSPERWRAGLGVSYRFDMHKINTYIFKDKEEEARFLEEKQQRENNN